MSVPMLRECCSGGGDIHPDKPCFLCLHRLRFAESTVLGLRYKRVLLHCFYIHLGHSGNGKSMVDIAAASMHKLLLSTQSLLARQRKSTTQHAVGHSILGA